MLVYQRVYGGFLKWGYPQIIHFNRMFIKNPTILGIPHLWKSPYVYLVFPNSQRQCFKYPGIPRNTGSWMTMIQNIYIYNIIIYIYSILASIAQTLCSQRKVEKFSAKGPKKASLGPQSGKHPGDCLPSSQKYLRKIPSGNQTWQLNIPFKLF